MTPEQQEQFDAAVEALNRICTAFVEAIKPLLSAIARVGAAICDWAETNRRFLPGHCEPGEWRHAAWTLRLMDLTFTPIRWESSHDR